MGITDALKRAGFKAERSTIGDKPIFEGVYKASLFEVGEEKDNGFGPAIMASFKIQETLTGRDSNSQYPEFKGFFKTSPEKVNSKRDGLAKLINGLFSVGVDIDTSSDEALKASLEAAKGTVCYISGFKKEPMKQDASGAWVDNPEGEVKQGFTFLTEKNAMKEVKKAGAPF